LIRAGILRLTVGIIIRSIPAERSRWAPAPNDKADLVSSIGARYVSSEQVRPARLAEMMGTVDVVYEAVGASKAAFEVMEVLGANGVFVFTGVPGRKAPIPIDTDLLMRNLVLKNQVVFGTVNAGKETYQAAIRDLEAFARRSSTTIAAGGAPPSRPTRQRRGTRSERWRKG